MGIRKRITQPLTDAQKAEVVRLLDSHETIKAVKYIMDETKLGLAKSNNIRKNLETEMWGVRHGH